MHNSCEILIVDQQPFIRLGLSEFLTSALRSKNVKCQTYDASDIQSAMSLAKQHTPNVAIVDLAFIDDNSVDLIKSLRTINRDISILIFSVQDERLHAERVIRAGANGYVMKCSPPEELISAMEHICAGGVWHSEDMQNNLRIKASIRHKSGPVDIKTGISRMSKRELEIFKLIGGGLKRLEIVEHTSISINTFETHRRSIKHKFGIKTSDELSRIAFLALHDGCL